MGTEVTLDLNGNMIDWGKNAIDLHHGPLFQESDRVELPADPDEDESDIYRKTLRRSLGAVLPRLQLMGIGSSRLTGVEARSQKNGVLAVPIPLRLRMT